ncbi:MAG TPA: HAMP domain-containing sensor histidine kinase, partial [Ignavibacteriaceae bacterium]|nr:HAMP domain-containing sensor histidine kinase [Ignavibacteriaceae bacterium]
NYVFIADGPDGSNLRIYPEQKGSSEKETVTGLLSSKQEVIKKLYDYKKNGYLKLEPVDISPANTMALFILNDNSLCGVSFNPVVFINQLLNSKMQSIAGNEFILAVYKPGTNNIILSTSPVDIREIKQMKSLWLIPQYNLGITLKGETIEELVKARSTRNLILIVGIALLIFAGIWLVFRNIKKEIQLAQIKSDFVSNVSHELRTPLSLISMFAETLEMGRVKTEEKKNEYYSIIHSETSRLSNIVNKVLNFSKMEAGKRTYHFEPVDLNEISDKIFNTYCFHLQNHGFAFNFTPDKEIPKLNLDPDAISEAIVNLIDNAVKYSENTKAINLRIGSENGFVFVEVEDKGIGISESDQKKIFDKFFRVSSGYVHNTKGTGLGLSLVKQIVQAHKGKIKLISSVGKGSCFKLLFPVE